MTVSLADDPLGTVALDGAADLFGDGDAHAVDLDLQGVAFFQEIRLFVRKDVEDNSARGSLLSVFVSLLKEMIFAK